MTDTNSTWPADQPDYQFLTDVQADLNKHLEGTEYDRATVYHTGGGIFALQVNLANGAYANFGESDGFWMAETYNGDGSLRGNTPLGYRFDREDPEVAASLIARFLSLYINV